MPQIPIFLNYDKIQLDRIYAQTTTILRRRGKIPRRRIFSFEKALHYLYKVAVRIEKTNVGHLFAPVGVVGTIARSCQPVGAFTFG